VIVAVIGDRLPAVRLLPRPLFDRCFGLPSKTPSMRRCFSAAQ
jgi:hypothetical protein